MGEDVGPTIEAIIDALEAWALDATGDEAQMLTQAANAIKGLRRLTDFYREQNRRIADRNVKIIQDCNERISRANQRS